MARRGGGWWLSGIEVDGKEIEVESSMGSQKKMLIDLKIGLAYG